MLVTYESDVPTAQRRIEAAARGVEGVIEGGPSIRIGAARYPATPNCLIDAFADHGVSLTLRFWVREPYRIQTLRSTVQEALYDAIEETDAEFAYPHSHLVFDETSGDLEVTQRSGGRGGRPQVRADRHLRSDRPPDGPGED